MLYIVYMYNCMNDLHLQEDDVIAVTEETEASRLRQMTSLIQQCDSPSIFGSMRRSDRKRRKQGLAMRAVDDSDDMRFVEVGTQCAGRCFRRYI